MDDHLDILCGKIQKSCKLTAVGMGLLNGGHAPLISVVGQRWHKSGIPVRPTDRWHIGSITKSITSTIIAHQISNGKYEFDTPIGEILHHIPIHHTHNKISVKQLLTHTSGLRANFSFKVRISKPEPNESPVSYRARLISDVMASGQRLSKSNAYNYSNVGYAVAGHIAETVAGISYESLVQRDLFDKCNLKSAGFGAPRGNSRDDEPMGHSSFLWVRKRADPFTSWFTDNGIELSAAGRVHMNLNDLLSYGKLHLANSGDSGFEISNPNWNMLHTPELDDYACGWVIENHDWAGGPMLWHNGSNTLWYALLMLLPAKDMVLAIVTNNGSVAKAERAFFNAAQDIVKKH